jgi:uncharacterized protein DUF955
MTANRYRSPQTLLNELGITEPQDIRMEAIARFCGASVRYKTLEGCEARITGYRDRAIISVNRNSLRARQRFSIGHELGHWMCDQGSISFSCAEKVFATEWLNSNPERRANRYAADILLPDSMFRPLAKGRDIDFVTVRDLASKFQTSLVATTIRLVEMGWLPSMVVCSESGKRRWFIRDPIVTLWPLDQPARGSLAYDLLHDDDSVISPTNVCADSWIDHPDAHRYELQEDSILMNIPGEPDLVLSLLWWKDEQQLLDLEDE